MATAIVNGRRINIPDAGISGSDLDREANPKGKSGRRTVLRDGIHATTVNPNKTYTKDDLINKKGKPVHITDMPDRTKGSGFWELVSQYLLDQIVDDEPTENHPTRTTAVIPATNQDNLFWGRRTKQSKRIITEQVLDIASNLFKTGIQFDEKDANWVIINHFVMPRKWHGLKGVVNGGTPLMIVFPTKYPKVPPIGFYLLSDIPKSPNGHLFHEAYHMADKRIMQNGDWQWYCTYVNPGSWQPSGGKAPYDWKRGDNLWTYVTLVTEALTSKY